MPKCFICNKYIYIYIYICLIDFIANEDEYKYYLRFDGNPKMKWEFELDTNTEGGLKLSNQLKNQKKIEIQFFILSNSLVCKYSLLNTESSLEDVRLMPNYIVANTADLSFVFEDEQETCGGAQKIGQLISLEGMSESNLKSLAQGDFINLVLSYERIKEPNSTKIPEKNKIVNIFYLLLLFIILFIYILIIK